MNFWQKGWYKISHYEYWPLFLFYFPVSFYFAWLIVRNRSLFFFTSSNPSFEFGGLTGTKKTDIFKLLPKKYLPKTILFENPVSENEVLGWMKENQINFPIILKPNMGERGWMVEIVKNEEQIIKYLLSIKVPFIAQEYISLPIEIGVFYVRHPNHENGKVTSVTRKEFLGLTGDGKNTISTLLKQNPRAVLQFQFDSPYKNRLDEVLPAGKDLIVEEIGNHCRGTKFLDGSNLIDNQLNNVFNELCKQIKGFYFGRFDLRCESLGHLKKGEFKIIELNGAGSEPVHIYQSGFGILNAYKVIIWHLSQLSKVSRANHQLGIKYLSLKDGIRKVYQIWKYSRIKRSSP